MEPSLENFTLQWHSIPARSQLESTPQPRQGPDTAMTAAYATSPAMPFYGFGPPRIASELASGYARVVPLAKHHPKHRTPNSTPTHAHHQPNHGYQQSPTHGHHHSQRRKIRYATRFAARLRSQALPVPPSILRGLSNTPAVAPTTSCPLSNMSRKDLSGRIKVLIRSTRSSVDSPVLRLEPRRRQVTLLPGAGKDGSNSKIPKMFGFDGVFSAEESQSELCSAALGDGLQAVINGFDACVLCYGADHQANLVLARSDAFIGYDDHPANFGLLPTAIAWLFKQIEGCRGQASARHSVRLSAVEVAGDADAMKDLLLDAPECDAPHPSHRSSPTSCEDVTELRALTAEQAALYLDAALHARTVKQDAPESVRRTAHLFFTIHLYQYRVDSGSSVSGGRSRLHLVFLAPGARSSKPDRSCLTAPALANVLLTVLQGQKHLPYRDNPVTVLLRDALGSVSCRAVSLVTCIAPEPDRMEETLTTLQIAARVHRMRKRRAKPGSSAAGNSSDGTSSCEDRRRRFPRSSSEPDCTASSSEQSAAETVIFLGARAAAPTVPTVQECDEEVKEQTLGQRSHRTQQPLRMIDKQQVAELKAANKEIWIDGPSASKIPPTPPKQPVSCTVSSLDPEKHLMIQQWVAHQEQQLRDQRLIYEESGSLCCVGVPSANVESSCSVESSGAQSMDTSSTAPAPPMSDAAVQITEEDIDQNCVGESEYEAVRLLEDIAEVEDERYESSEAPSDSRLIMIESTEDQLVVSVPTIDEALDAGFTTSGAFAHPLRALSRESITVLDECPSIPGSGVAVDEEEELLDEDALERAMAASMTSVRSCDLIEKLKAEERERGASVEPAYYGLPAEIQVPDISSLPRHSTFRPSSVRPYLDQNGNSSSNMPSVPAHVTTSLPRKIVPKPTGSSKSLSPTKVPKPANRFTSAAVTKSATDEELRAAKHADSRYHHPTMPLQQLATEVANKLEALKRSQEDSKSIKTPKHKQFASIKSGVPVAPKSSPARKSIEQQAGVTLRAPPPKALKVSPASKRASSGYDSGNDSGIASTVDKTSSPELNLASPYNKLTKPRTSHRSSSGHGSDNSSIVTSSDVSQPARTRLSLALHPTTRVSNRAPQAPQTSANRNSVAVSSGYESAQSGTESTSTAVKSCSVARPPPLPVKPTQLTGPRTPPSCKVIRKKISALTLGRDGRKCSQSAPQSPCTSFQTSKAPVIPPTSAPAKPKVPPRTKSAMSSNIPNNMNKQDREQRVEELRLEQTKLKAALADAKGRLCIPDNKWDYELHVDACMSIQDPSLVEALAQETHILEKRVAACRSHAMLVTVFDSSASR